MATDDSDSKGSEKGLRQTHIKGDQNSGIIAGHDIHGASLGNLPRPRPEEAPAPVPGTASAPVLRILFLNASPEDAPALRVDQEFREVDLAMRQSEFRDHFDLRQQPAVRPGDLQAALLRHRPQILHFSGHGNKDGICFEDESGMKRKVQASVLSRILGVFKKQIRCVVLNACWSQDQAEAIAKDIDCVVGMSAEIGDRAAIQFSTAFYQALAYGSSVDEAFQLGCAQIDLDGLGEGATPQLIAIKKDPGEVVFVEGGR